MLAQVTRTCSYDRAGYGFSSLGSNLPRDLHRAVDDLKILLERSGEPPPYVLAGHSNGGLMISSFANLHPERVAALLFFDAVVALPGDVPEPAAGIDPSLRARLEKIQRCLARAEAGLIPTAHDDCVNTQWYSDLPRDLAAAEIANRSKVDYWRAYLSEAGNNYSSTLSRQARALLPHRWTKMPVRVFIASVSQLSDEAAARSFGINPEDKAALAAAREARAIGERRQERICEHAPDCLFLRVPTANHLVHNEVLSEVVESVLQLIVRIRRG